MKTSPPTPAAVLIALRRSERQWERDVAHALAAWGRSDPSTVSRQQRLDSVQARIAKLEQPTKMCQELDCTAKPHRLTVQPHSFGLYPAAERPIG